MVTTSHMKPSVLLLGTAHIGNRNRDTFNTQFDDMLAPQRQREIQGCYTCYYPVSGLTKIM